MASLQEVLQALGQQGMFALNFVIQAPAASTTAQMGRMAQGGFTLLRVPVPWDCGVSAIGAEAENSLTGGTITFKARQNGVVLAAVNSAAMSAKSVVATSDPAA